jgi:hypothetical protein
VSAKWGDGLEMKYSAAEMNDRDAAADSIWEHYLDTVPGESTLPPQERLKQLTPEERRLWYTDASNLANESFKALGSRGTPIFAELSYYRYGSTCQSRDAMPLCGSSKLFPSLCAVILVHMC